MGRKGQWELSRMSLFGGDDDEKWTDECVMTYVAVAHCIRCCDEDSSRPAAHGAEKD
jgi:hypothetical protein